MRLPDDVLDVLSGYGRGPVRSASSVGGGCIAHATRIETAAGVYFLKWSRDAPGHTFEAEAAGLHALAAAAAPLLVPEVVGARNAAAGKPGVLLLSWIEPGRPDRAFWTRFGPALAELHRQAGERYGFEGDNFIGRLPQRNTWSDRWPDFFRANRLEPQVDRARAAGRWQAAWERPLDTLYGRLDELLPARPRPSVLHGDLWSGNFMATTDGAAALFDPAAYYGDRETDLAMTELFGGFDATFYPSYREAWPLDPGYDRRRDVYNLYHLINHLNHFGEGYAGAVEATLMRYGR